jgi:hypothetical protein
MLCVTANPATHVRFGSKADIEAPFANVRFTPESRHRLNVLECPLCAKSGLMHCSNSVVIRSPRPGALAKVWVRADQKSRRSQQRAEQPGSGRCATCDTTAMPAVTTKTNAKIIIIFFTIVSPLRPQKPSHFEASRAPPNIIFTNEIIQKLVSEPKISDQTFDRREFRRYSLT